jgi:hypothetical protein
MSTDLLKEYDEAEDLTADMVRAWLRAKGWERDSTGDLAGEECWLIDGGSRGTVWLGRQPKKLAHVLKSLCIWTGRSPQSLLREINPRMRPGWPTEGEIEAHENRGGLWLCKDDDEPAIVIGRFVSSTRFRHTEWLKKPGVIGYGVDKDNGERLRFWPCNEHGDKVRRGTVA